MQACTAGARFLVSPGMTPELAAAALATERPYLPGVATPSEVMTARGLGIALKCEDGASRPLAPAIAAFLAPFAAASAALADAPIVNSRGERVGECVVSFTNL